MINIYQIFTKYSLPAFPSPIESYIGAMGQASVRSDLHYLEVKAAMS